MAQKVSKTTTDHETIRAWVEERGGWPAEVEATAGREGETGIIRIDFPGYAGQGTLRRVSWDEWFRKFDETNLAFVYEDATAAGQRSSFNKLVARETAEARAEERRTSPRGGRARSAGAGRSKTAKRGAAAKRGAKRATAKRGAGGRRRTTGGQAARTASRRGTSRRAGARKSRRGER